jgi:DNA modification methylase
MPGPLETGVIYCDDAWRRLAAFPASSVDLIYLDPPFFSNRKYEVIWGDEAEVRSFEDRWDGGIQVYVAWMRDRVLEMRRVLKPTGTIYLHCDQHASHYLKVMMDEVFGRNRFLNEIIWHYQTSSGAPKKWLHRNHDTILRYAAGDPDDVTWNHPRQPWPETTLRKWQKDEDGRVYRLQNKFGKRYYIDPAGKLDDDVWEITLSARTSERLGYPTQKPQALLEKIIGASSNPGDVVVDPFCGCGTAIAAAETLDRRWIGIDISPTAVRVMQARMARLGVTAKVVGMPVTDAELRELKPFEFQNLIIAAMNGTHAPRKTGDMGIDGYSWFEHHPIQVKQSEHVGRNVVDNFETALERAGNKVGYIVAFSFTRGAREEVARVRAAKGVDIRLTLASQLLAHAPQPVQPHEVQMPPKASDLPPATALVASIRNKLAVAESPEPYGPEASPEAQPSPQASKRGR